MINQYKAEINTLESVDQVNQWCKEKTHNKIPKILDSLSPNDLMVLINAIYFKGIWTKQFNRKDTYKMNFYNYGIIDNAVTAAVSVLSILSPRDKI